MTTGHNKEKNTIVHGKALLVLEWVVTVMVVVRHNNNVLPIPFTTTTTTHCCYTTATTTPCSERQNKNLNKPCML